jgi:hypothetical protein
MHSIVPKQTVLILSIRKSIVLRMPEKVTLDMDDMSAEQNDA